MSRKKSPPVTCDAGLLSRVPKHPICPLPHLRCRSILREPVPIVVCTPCEMMPPFISRRLCVEIGDRRYSYSSSIGDTGGQRRSPFCLSSSLDADAVAEACRHRCDNVQGAGEGQCKHAASCCLLETSAILRARRATLACFSRTRIAECARSSTQGWGIAFALYATYCTLPYRIRTNFTVLNVLNVELAAPDHGWSAIGHVYRGEEDTLSRPAL